MASHIAVVARRAPAVVKTETLNDDALRVSTWKVQNAEESRTHPKTSGTCENAAGKVTVVAPAAEVVTDPT